MRYAKDEAVRAAINYGASVLGMLDTEMAAELCLTRERVRQLRSVPKAKRRPREPEPSRLKPCPAGCGRQCKATSEVCSRCWTKTPEGRARLAEKHRRWARTNPVKVKEQHRRYVEENREKVRGWARRYYHQKKSRGEEAKMHDDREEFENNEVARDWEGERHPDQPHDLIGYGPDCCGGDDTAFSRHPREDEWEARDREGRFDLAMERLEAEVLAQQQPVPPGWEEYKEVAIWPEDGYSVAISKDGFQTWRQEIVYPTGERHGIADIDALCRRIEALIADPSSHPDVSRLRKAQERVREAMIGRVMDSEPLAWTGADSLDPAPAVAEEVGVGPQEVDLLANPDAKVWAEEFLRLFGERRAEIDEGLMLAWFANAIMVGWDHGRARLLEEQERERAESADGPRFGERLLEWLAEYWGDWAGEPCRPFWRVDDAEIRRLAAAIDQDAAREIDRLERGQLERQAYLRRQVEEAVEELRYALTGPTRGGMVVTRDVLGAEELLERLDRIFGDRREATPWPLVDILERLCTAADHLLGDHNCDCHGIRGAEGRERCCSTVGRKAMSLLVDPHFWMGVGAGLFAGFLLAFPLAMLVRSPLPGKGVVGAVRPRCEICETAWSVPASDPYDDLNLCPDCRGALNAARDAFLEGGDLQQGPPS